MDTLTREEMQRRLVAVATADPRVVGLLISGSPSEGRADRWSDVDAELFLRDADCGAFTADWIPWAGRLGGLLLAYVGGIGHPWAVYAAAPAPLRVDFSFIPESEIPGVRAWPIAPLSVESIVFYDATGGRLRALVAERVGRSLSPDDPAVAYGAVCGDFWYYVLRTWGRIARADQWGARQDLHSIVLNLLAALLRLEIGATARWQASSAAIGLEAVITPERRAALDRCIPGPGLPAVHAALAATVALGRTVCEACQARYGWPWPRHLALQIADLLAPLPPAPPGAV